MSKGIIYVMTTVVPGLIKIGKTGSDSFDRRMYSLEHNGYSNVVGLKRHFAIEVEDYDEKEILLDDIFSKSRLENTELFALDVDLVVQLLSSFEGKQIYPKPEIISKEEVFDEATENRDKDKYKVPNGIYFFARKPKGGKLPKAMMRVDNGKFIVLSGSECSEYTGTRKIFGAVAKAIIRDGKLVEDVECNSPSIAGVVVLGKETNGWVSWKDEKGNLIDVYRKERESL